MSNNITEISWWSVLQAEENKSTHRKLPALCNLRLFSSVHFLQWIVNRCVSDTSSAVTIITGSHDLRQWLVAGWSFSPNTTVSQTNKPDRYDITETLLKVALNIITPNLLRTWVLTQINTDKVIRSWWNVWFFILNLCDFEYW